MPLVFVHGVNVRHGDLYNRELAFRNRHFAEVLYPQLGKNIDEQSIYNPYLGDLGASISSDTPFLPRGNYEMLWRKHLNQPGGNESELEMEAFIESSPTPLLDLARSQSFPGVIDLLWDLMDEELLQLGNSHAEESKDNATMFQEMINYGQSAEGQELLARLKTDDELLHEIEEFLQNNTNKRLSKTSKTGVAKLAKSAGNRLQKRFSELRDALRKQSKSLGERLKEDISHARLQLREKTVSTTAKIFNQPLRNIFHQQCALLIGDAFAYFSARGDMSKASPIAERVMADLRAAHQAKRDESDELIVIGHSMGGVILCDIVSCYGKDIPIDVLITVGSQFPLFADLNMFHGISPKERPVPRPSNVKHWINIFDPHDFLGYPASHIFSGVSDFHLPTYEIGASTHTNYFNRRSFYFQLARRLSDYVPVLSR